MNTNIRRAAVLAFLSIALPLASPVQAAITVIDHWKIADGDPGAANGVTPTNLVDSAGAHSLTFSGAGIYTNDVASAAWAHANSSGSVNLAGGFAYSPIVSTAINNFGIEAWVRVNATNANGSAVIYNGHTGTSGWGIDFDGTSFGGLMGGQVAFGTITPQLGVWTHVALVRDSGFCTFYSNGVAVAITGTGPNTPAGNFAIGIVPQQAPGGGTGVFQGEVDEGRVFTFTAGAFSTNDLLIYTTNLALGRSSIVLSPAAQTNSITLSATPGNAAWTASPGAAWLHLLSLSGSGSTNVAFYADTNSGATRSGTLTIAGQTVSVTQAGAGFVPATAITIGDTLSATRGVAVDAAGNVFVSDSGFGRVYELPAGSNHWVTLINSGLPNPSGLAVDNMGDLFVVDAGDNQIRQWTLANSNYTTLPISGLNLPLTVAVDGANNLFIADFNNSAVKVWSNNTATVSTLVSSTGTVPGAAVDRAGNVYFTANLTLHERIAASGTVVTLPFAYFANAGIAVDGSGNIISPNTSPGSYEVDEFFPSTQLSKVLTTDANDPGNATVDAAGNIFYASTYAGVVKELQNTFVNSAAVIEGTNAGSDTLPAVVPSTANLSGFFFPTSDQPWLTITGVTNGAVHFSFQANPLNTGIRTAHIIVLGVSVPVSQIGVVFTVGINSLVEGSGSGTDSVALAVSPANSTWSASTNDTWLHLSAANQNGTGSTNVIFTFDANPSTAARVGSLTIGGRAVTVTQAGTAYALGSQTVVLLTNKVIVPSGLAVTSGGEVYVGDSANKDILHYTVSQGIFFGIANPTSPPQGIALDYNNNVYWADSQPSIQELVPPFPATPFAVATAGLSSGPALAIDSATNIYLAQPLSGNIVKWSPTFGNATAVTGPALPNSSALAADVAGNIYAASTSLNRVSEWNASSGVVTTLASGLHSPTAIAVDGSGNIYYNDNTSSQILKRSAATGAIIPAAAGIGSNPLGLGVDALGNVYIADTTNNRVEGIFSAYVPNSMFNLPNYASVTTLPALIPAATFPYQVTPTTDVPWISVQYLFNGVVRFVYYANTGAPRTGHITVLGVPITINQAGGFIPPTLTGTTISGGQMQFSFTAPGGGGGTYAVYSSTNVALPITQWTFVNYASYLGGINYSFSTPVNTNDLARFFIVVAP
jgi:streptogramin lyase